MKNELYLMASAILVLFIIGIMVSTKMKRRSKDINRIISWFNHMISQFMNIYNNVVNQFNEKMELAKKYKDKDSLKRLGKLYEDTIRTAENIEHKLNALKSNLSDKRLKGKSLKAIYTDLKVVESYIAELANIATLIRSIHPINKNTAYDYQRFTFYEEPKTEKPWESSMYFSSCNTKEELTKTYRELAKIYHPDNTLSGDSECFKKVKHEYDEYIKII